MPWKGRGPERRTHAQKPGTVETGCVWGRGPCDTDIVWEDRASKKNRPAQLTELDMFIMLMKREKGLTP